MCCLITRNRGIGCGFNFTVGFPLSIVVLLSDPVRGQWPAVSCETCDYVRENKHSTHNVHCVIIPLNSDQMYLGIL